MRIPLEEIRIRILKKMIIRLQLREEMIKMNEDKIKSKFLAKFLLRKPILKLLCKDLFLSSIPNEEGLPEESELTGLIIKLLGMLLN